MTVCIIDYGIGNIASIYHCIKYINHEVIVSSNIKDIKASSHLILPGVGSFKKAMKELNGNKIIPILNDQVLVKKKPILGICLGMQLFATDSNEDGYSEGLNWIEGNVEKINNQDGKLKIPHIGWNDVALINKSHICKSSDKDYYFVHSYHFKVKNEKYMTGVCNYGSNIASIVEKYNIFGTQFHPEKSSDAGLEIIKNFIMFNYNAKK